MIYGFISSLDDETTKVFFRSKKIRAITFIMLEVLVNLHRFCRVEM
ncbi:hypothetical protein [Acetivibrio ethanolgignens]|nr:hypothetical protein [Acetivibrio ethanolgignens]